MILGHGDDIYKHNQQLVSNFSSNVDTHQDLSALRQHLARHLDVIHSYPEADAHSLVASLAKKHKVEDENICVTNGATEAIYLLAQAFRGCRTSIVIPTFSEYEDACTIHAHQLSFLSSLEEVEQGTQLVWLCNPNNPTGAIYSKERLISIVNAHKDTSFVFDQSYEAFSSQSLLSIQEALALPNVILLHSMTKCFAIPGLRLGYITASQALIAKINGYRMPWSVNQLAIEAGKFLLGMEQTNNLDQRLADAQKLSKALGEIDGLVVFPSETLFFLCQLKHKKASDLKAFLIDEHGILIRDASNFRGLDEHYFRIASQTQEENNRLIEALKSWI